MLDSGCTAHVTPHKSDFVHYHDFPVPGHAKTAGQDVLEIPGHGIVMIQVAVNGKHRNLALRNVLYIPDASERLFSPNLAIQRGHELLT